MRRPSWQRTDISEQYYQACLGDGAIADRIKAIFSMKDDIKSAKNTWVSHNDTHVMRVMFMIWRRRA